MTGFTSNSFTGKIALIVLFAFQLAFAGEDVFFNVLNYGVDRSGEKKNTEKIAQIIEKATEQGGATLYFPAGVYLTGPIHLQSNITLYLDAGAVLKFSDDFDDYLPFVTMRWEGTVNQNFSPLIYARNCTNISIIGQGTLDGQGQKWWDFYNKIRKEMQKNGHVTTSSKWQEMHRKANRDVAQPDTWNWTENQFLRPPMIQLFQCSKIRINGITLQNSPFWNINPVFCDNLTVDGVTITAPPESHNTDGINPSSCSNVHITNSHISVGDDCITIKSGRDEDGRKWGKPCENITITNCTMLNGHGGVVIGSEMSGGVKKVTISNCVFEGTDRGIRIKTMRGRGATVEDVQVSNIVMNNIIYEAFMMNMMYQKTDPEPVSERTPEFRNIHISNVTVSNAHQAGKLIGLAEMPIHDVSFSNMSIQAEKGFEVLNAKDLSFHDIRISNQDGSLLSAENVSGLVLDFVKTSTDSQENSAVLLTDCSNVFVNNSMASAGAGAFLTVKGSKSSDIVLGFNDFSRLTHPVVIGPDVRKGSLTYLIK